MAKPTIKFNTYAFDLGGNTGYRPQLESQDGIYDLDFCKEVVTEKRLSMSADELLHALEMVGEVAPAKVAADGRPRGVTKLLKWNRFAYGSLESPTSAWGGNCRAVLKPQLMTDAEKELEATFVNVNDGINVKVNNVAWLGAQSVTNVVKIGKQFAAYGNHMEFIVGKDHAFLKVGEVEYPLTCVESDVAHAVFNWPAELVCEAGTQATFMMFSRGGVQDGEVYTSKKNVTVIDGVIDPKVTKMYSPGHEDDGKIAANPTSIKLVGEGFSTLTKDNVAFTCEGDDVTIPSSAAWTFTATGIVIDNGDTAMATGGSSGDELKVTITKEGCPTATFSTELV